MEYPTHGSEKMHSKLVGVADPALGQASLSAIDVVCAVLRRGGRTLLCRRPAGVHLAGHWEFPGGKVDAGESPREALIREIHEELGCVVDVGDALVPIDHVYPQVAIRLQAFHCTLVTGEPQALEHDELGWFARGQVAALGLAGADAAVWRQLAVLDGRPPDH